MNRATIRWIPPPRDSIKLNFDVSARGNLGKSGVASILRDWQGNFVGAVCSTLLDGINNITKFNAVRLGLEMVIKLSIPHVHIEGDSMVVVSTILNGNSNSWHSKYLLSHIQIILNKFSSFQVMHCYREANGHLDHLSNKEIDEHISFKFFTGQE